MPFSDSYFLPGYRRDDAARYLERWNKRENARQKGLVQAAIERGAGKDFLALAFERGELPMLEGKNDLKGYPFNEGCGFPTDQDIFVGIDFSYAQFQATITGANFFQCDFTHNYLQRAKFTNCRFFFSYFFAGSFAHVEFDNCEFDKASFSNCRFENTVFRGCRFSDAAFSDCALSSGTRISDPPTTLASGARCFMEPGILADFYLGVSRGYAAGGADELSDAMHIRSKRAERTYGKPSSSKKAVSYLADWFSGYGTSPLRLLLGMCLVIAASSIAFLTQAPISKAILIAAGAFFTFGASSDAVAQYPWFLEILYVMTSFAGLTLNALFITLWANRYLSRR